MNKNLKKILKQNYIAIILMIVVAVIQLLAYNGTRLINSQMKSFDLSIGFIDNNIPFINWFIIFYVACYPWWYLGPLLNLKYNRLNFYEYLSSAALGYIIGGIIFIALPTEIQRPVIDNDNIFNILVNFIYANDIPANNLFPSFHCFISWNVYLSIRGNKEVPAYYRIGYLVFAILVCASTVLVKQHFFIDIFAGIILAEITFFISKRIKLPKKLLNFEQKHIKESL